MENNIEGKYFINIQYYIGQLKWPIELEKLRWPYKKKKIIIQIRIEILHGLTTKW